MLIIDYVPKVRPRTGRSLQYVMVWVGTSIPGWGQGPRSGHAPGVSRHANGTMSRPGRAPGHACLSRSCLRAARSIATRRLPERYGSDHYPLLTVVDF